MTDTRRQGSSLLRLTLGFSIVIVLFATAMVTALVTLSRITQAERVVARVDMAKHAGHMAANLVREQFIRRTQLVMNQAAGQTADEPGYQRAALRARTAIAHVTKFATTTRETELAKELAERAAEVDGLLNKAIAPRGGDQAVLAQLHGRMNRAVAQVVALNEQLNRQLEQRSKRVRRSAERLRNRARVILVVCFVLAIILAAIVGARIVRSITTPLSALHEGVSQVGEGDLTVRVDVPGNDEFSALADAFNGMTADLQKQQQLLVRSQRMASVGQLAAGVAHEINNPLGVILGYVRLLQRDGEQDNEALTIIEDETRQCQNIVKSLLELARADRLSLTKLDLTTVTRDVVSRLETGGAMGETNVKFAEDTPGVSISGDEPKLRQVITNMLTNAAEASPSGSAINVTLTEDDDGVSLAVIDQGRGIGDDHKSKVFDPFFTTKADGLGLGLAIAGGIATAHGGHVHLEPGEPKGTRATLWLPKGATAGGDA